MAHASTTAFPVVPAPEAGRQANACLNPSCTNFGVPAPASTPRGGPRPAGSGSPSYGTKVNRKTAPDRTLVCGGCGRTRLLKSNRGIQAELERLSRPMEPSPDPSCPTSGCENAGVGLKAAPER